MTARIELRVDVDAPVEDTWRGATDWLGQGEWMLGTRVWPTRYSGEGEGARIAAFTGVGRWGFLDPMEITRWDPPHACHVKHLGSFIRGTGTFEVLERPGDRSTFVWGEQLDLPFGALGRLGWPLAKPVFGAGVQVSLNRFARWVEAGRARDGDPQRLHRDA